MPTIQQENNHKTKLNTLRSNRKKLKKAFKEIAKNGTSTFVADKYTDSLQDLTHQATTKLGLDSLDNKDYIISNGIRVGMHTITEDAYLLWKGDKTAYIKILKSHGLNIINEDDMSEKTTININLMKS